MSEEKKIEKTEHKVGEKLYAQRGNTSNIFLIVGAPRVKSERWVTIAPTQGGLLQSFPEDEFERSYWAVGTNE